MKAEQSSFHPGGGVHVPFIAISGGLAQNFPPAMVSSRGPYYLLTRKDSNVFLQKGPLFSKKGALLHDFEGGHGPAGHWVSPPLIAIHNGITPAWNSSDG